MADKTRKPVYDGYLADPFVWRHDGAYFAIGTGEREAAGQAGDMVFPLLRSEDFCDWKLIGHALLRPDTSLGTHFWAPEVAFDSGKFYLYYSVGFGDKHHQLRVATSEFPLGPFQDAGHPLIDPRVCPFAIDAHPFRNDDGQCYLFYARDFLKSDGDARIGTGLMLARFNGMTELVNAGEPILRARSDWQRFEADRQLYAGRYDWHTLEGPFVLKRDGRYYCFYSGGRWENETYGVDYGVASQIDGPYSDAGNEFGPRVLRTVAGQLIGPGHNSVVAAPNGQDYIVYHAWDATMTARRTFMEPLLWTPLGPRAASQV